MLPNKKDNISEEEKLVKEYQRVYQSQPDFFLYKAEISGIPPNIKDADVPKFIDNGFIDSNEPIDDNFENEVSENIMPTMPKKLKKPLLYSSEIYEGKPISPSTKKRSQRNNEVKLIEDLQTIQELRDNLEIKFEPSNTLLYVVVIAKNEKLNSKRKIKCAGATAIKGYVYDAGSDCYIVECCHVSELGVVDQIAYLSVPNTGNWRISIPLPNSVLEKCLNNQQRKIVKDIQNNFPSSGYCINYVQMIDVWN